MLAQMCNDFIAQRWLLFVVTNASAHDCFLLLINNVFNLAYTGRPSPAPTANISEIYYYSNNSGSSNSPSRAMTQLPTSMAATSRTPSKSPTTTPTGF